MGVQLALTMRKEHGSGVSENNELRRGRGPYKVEKHEERANYILRRFIINAFHEILLCS
jgi:hypothetical protein